MGVIKNHMTNVVTSGTIGRDSRGPRFVATDLQLNLAAGRSKRFGGTQ